MYRTYYIRQTNMIVEWKDSNKIIMHLIVATNEKRLNSGQKRNMNILKYTMSFSSEKVKSVHVWCRYLQLANVTYVV